MRDLELRSGVVKYADVVVARSPMDSAQTVDVGITHETFQRFHKRMLATAIAQYYGIVQGSMMSAVHLYKGLKRPLMLADDMHADQTVLAYTWRPETDFEWSGSPYDGAPKSMTPPKLRVFVVLVREENGQDGISGSIERWNWVREDPKLPHAPVDWDERYNQRLWSVST